MRAANIREKLEDSAQQALPKRKMLIRTMSERLRSCFERARATNGDPNVTLSAYEETIMPALGMLMRNDCARSGSNPMMTYSEVPMPKAAIVSARIDFRMNLRFTFP